MPTHATYTGGDVSTLLAATAAFACAAPSVRNSQPWRWRVTRTGLDLLLERRRVVDSADPHARLGVLSCGAALHHAVAHLEAAGWRPDVRRLPGPGPDLLARLEIAGRAEVDPAVARLAEAAADRRTDRRVMPTLPLDLACLHPIVRAAREERAELRLLRPNQIFALAAAFDAAQRQEWTAAQSGARPGTATAPVAIGAAPARRAPFMWAPSGTAFAQPWAGAGSALDPPAGGSARHRAGELDGATLIAESHEHTAVFAVLHGPGDDREHWLRAGEALSAAWLTATCLGVTVLPFSAVVEQPTTREAVRRLLGRPGHPYLVVRFAAADPDAPVPPPGPRLPLSETVVRG